MTDTDLALLEALAHIPRPWDPEDMRETLAALHAVLDRFPDEALALAEVGGGYDTAGEEATAAGYDERALAAGLTGDDLRRVLLQHGSRSDAAVAELLLLAADAVPTADLQRYQRSIRGSAAELAEGHGSDT